MTRTVTNSNLSTPAARARLKPNPKPFWQAIDPGLDRTNDAYANLRGANASQQNANKRPLSTNKSGWKWAHRLPSGRRRAKITVNGKDRYLGTFDSAPEAHINAWSAARAAWGEFARAKEGEKPVARLVISAAMRRSESNSRSRIKIGATVAYRGAD